MLLDPNFLDLRFLDQNIIEPFFSQNFLIPNLGLKMFLNPISFYHKSGLKHLKKIVCLEHSFNQRCVLTWTFLNLIVLVQHTGRLKKTAWILLYPRNYITNMLESWDIIHWKGGIHSFVWSTKTFLYDIQEPRYKQIRIGYQISKYLNIGQF